MKFIFEIQFENMFQNLATEIQMLEKFYVLLNKVERVLT